MVNLKTRQVLMSGAISCSQGRMEYLIVGHGGKDYESLVRADVAPVNFNIALIGAGAAIPDSMDSRSFNDQTRRSDVWPLFRIEVFHLGAKGDLVHRRAEEFVLNQQSDQPMGENLWVYTNSHTYVDPDSGSEIWVANFSKSLVGVFFEASCVIQNGDDNWNSDDLYVANPAICPPDGTGVLVLLTLVREGKRQ
ncbi:MAG: YdjY domain-containing protein [Candidatus Brocadiia bacterium]